MKYVDIHMFGLYNPLYPNKSYTIEIFSHIHINFNELPKY